MTQTPEFEPQIVAFCCLHCAYAAADLAGGSRCGYPSSIKIVAVPCTGRVDSLHLIKALEDGADMLELDIHETSDGVIVVMHDELHRLDQGDDLRGASRV